jgi:hypothetical protein
MNLREALELKDATAQLACGMPCTLRRPSALDFIEAADFAQKNPTQVRAWLAHRHLKIDGAPAFATLEDALKADGRLVWEIGGLAEKLYEEGRD